MGPNYYCPSREIVTYAFEGVESTRVKESKGVGPILKLGKHRLSSQETAETRKRTGEATTSSGSESSHTATSKESIASTRSK